MNKIHALVNTLKQQNLTLAIAESMTCGMATDKLSGVKGISDVLRGSVVCYTPEVKIKLMGIKKSMIDRYTCESMEVTTELARKLSKLMPADIYAAITGLASPGGSETKRKPVGTVFLCVQYKKKVYKQKKVFKGSPIKIKRQTCHALYDFISHIVKKKN
jgi:nicotinamide-nucleotide amidase